MTMMMKARFSIDSIHVNFQRNKEDPDSDLVNFGVGTTHKFGLSDIGSDVSFDPINRHDVAGAYIGTPSSGAQIGPPITPPILTDELFFTDDDEIVITCYIRNGSHTDAAVHFANMLKVSGAVAAAIGGGIELLDKLDELKLSGTLKVVVSGGSLLGLIAALGGEILGDYGVALGLAEPDCDGPVFDSITSDKILKIPGSILADGISNGKIALNKSFILAEVTDDTQVSQTHCGHNPSTTITLGAIVTFAEPVVPKLGILPGPATSFVPKVGHVPDVWLNTWGDHDTIEGSSILCTVSESSLSEIASAKAGDAVRAKLALAPQVADLVGNLPRVAGQGPTTELPANVMVPGTPTAAGNTAIAIVAQHILAINVRERVSPVGVEIANVASNAAFSIPMGTTSFAGNSFAVDLSHPLLHPHVPGGTPEAAPYSPAAKDTAVSFAGSVSHPRFADSIALEGGVTLQLYSAFDASNHFVGPRLRYRRIGSGVPFTDTDVMLQPAQHVPK